MPNQDTHKVENGGAAPHAGTAETAPDAGKHALWSGRRLQFWLFCVLLGLALIGMGLTQASDGGGALYWLIVLWIYALFSLVRAWLLAKQRHESIWSEIHIHFFL